MNRTMKFMIAEGMMLMAFSYAAEGYQAAAAAASALSAAIAVSGTSVQTLKDNALKILAMSVAQLAAVRFLSSIGEEIPVIGAVIFFNTAASVLWMSRGTGEMKTVMRTMITVMLGFYAAALILPAARFGFADLMLYITLVFVPLTLCYAEKSVPSGKHVNKTVEEKIQLR